MNFNCTAPAASPAAYCSDDGSCACGAAADNPKKFTSAGICGKPLAEMAKIANEQCAFGQ